MKHFLTLIVFFLIAIPGDGQNKIIYELEPEIVDSLKSGIEVFSQLTKEHEDSLKFYALVEVKFNVLEIYLLEYSTLPQSGFLKVIEVTNRQIRITEKKYIPVLFMEDVFAETIKYDQIISMPLSGYYVKAIKEKNVFRVKESAFLF